MTIRITRRGILGTSAAVAVTSLSACGSGTPGEKAPENSATTPSGGELVTLQFWHRTFTPAENKWYANVVKKFNESQSKIKVVDTEVPADAWEQRLKAAQAANKAPDLYTHPGSIQDAVNSKQLHELNQIVGEDKLGEIIDAAKPVSQIDGKYYAYPLLLEPQTVLFWNKDMFNKAGLDPETPPKTWDELFSFCEKLMPTLEQGQYCIAPAQDAATFAWSTVGQQYNYAGHTALTKDWTAPDVQNAEYEALIVAYKTLWDKGYMPKQALAAYVEGKDFGQKKCAMKVSGSWMMSEIGSDYPDLLDKTGVAPFVTRAGSDRTATTLGNFKWVVDAKTQHAEAAGEFLAWCLAGAPENLVPFFVDTQFTKVPVRESVQKAVEATEGAAKAPWSGIVTNDIAPTAISEPRYPWDVSLAVGTAMEAGMKGAAAPAAALATAASSIKTVIDREKLPEKAPKES